MTTEGKLYGQIVKAVNKDQITDLRYEMVHREPCVLFNVGQLSVRVPTRRAVHVEGPNGESNCIKIDPLLLNWALDKAVKRWFFPSNPDKQAMPRSVWNAEKEVENEQLNQALQEAIKE